MYVTLKSINECKTPRKNIIDNRRRNEELILKYQKDEKSRYDFLKLISKHYAKLSLNKNCYQNNANTCFIFIIIISN
jgi:hypothetical protein